MKYYLLKIEQIIKNEAVTEYSSITKYNDIQSAEVDYYQSLANVSADIGKNHTYMSITILDSFGNTQKTETIGSYLVEKEE